MIKQFNTQCAWCGAYRQSQSWKQESHESAQAITHGICPSCATHQLKIPIETFKKLCQAEHLKTI